MDNEFVDNSDNENTFCNCCDERKKSKIYTIDNKVDNKLDKKIEKYYRYPKSLGQKTKIFFWKQSMNKK